MHFEKIKDLKACEKIHFDKLFERHHHLICRDQGVGVYCKDEGRNRLQMKLWDKNMLLWLSMSAVPDIIR